MLVDVKQWSEVLVCSVCLHQLCVSDNGCDFVCTGCETVFRYENNIPVFIENSKVLEGLKESSELGAQRLEHQNETARSQTAEWVHSRAADLLKKHHIVSNQTTNILEIGSGPFESLHDVIGNIKVSIDPLATSYRDTIFFQRSQSNIIQGFAEILPFKNDFFDILLARNSFDHLNNPDLAVLEFNRVLKPDGICIIECYVDSNPFVSHEPFVLTERYIHNYISRYFHVLSLKRISRHGGFAWDWVELELKPIKVRLPHRPYLPSIYKDVAESSIELYARGCEALKHHRLDEAIRFLEQSVAKDSDQFWNELMLVEGYVAARRYGQALECLGKMRDGLFGGRYPYLTAPERHLQRLLQVISEVKTSSQKKKQIRILLIVCLFESNFGDILIYLTVRSRLEKNGFIVDLYEVSQPLLTSNFFEKANNSDFILFAGGGIIERNAPDLIRHFDQIHHLLKAPYGIVGLSTGGFDYTPFARSLQMFADKAAFFFTRDTESVETFKKYGATRLPTAAVDVVFANEDIRLLQHCGSDRTANFRNIPYLDVTGDIDWRAWSASLRQAGVQYLLKDCSDAHTQLGLPISNSDILTDIAHSGLVVAMRFHVILVAALLGVPTIPIAYCPKVRRLAEQLGLSSYCLDIHDQDRLDEIVRLLTDNKVATMRTVAINTTKLRETANNVLNKAVTAIQELCQ